MKLLILAAGLLSLTSWGTAPVQIGSCAYDDGSSESALGLGGGGGFCWMHQFGSLGGGSNTISRIQVAYGSPALPGQSPGNGTPVTAAIWDDPNDDGDPSDAILMQTVSTTVSNVDTDILNTVILTPPVSVNDIFFIGASLTHAPGQTPASLDQSVASGMRAWIVGDSSGAVNLNNLAVNSLPPTELDANGTPGVFLLRLECGIAHAGADFFTTPDGTCTYQNFSSSPIPPNFFGNNSDAFGGSIFLIGSPLSGTNLPGGADTIVSRLADASLTACPSDATVPIQMVALSLVSYQPIQITFPDPSNPGGPHLISTYSVKAHLSSFAAQPVGQMVIHRTHDNGGTFDSTLPVIPRLVFTKVSGTLGATPVPLDPGPTDTFTAPTFGSNPPSWVFDDMGMGTPTSPGGRVDHDGEITPKVPYPASSNFIGGVKQVGADCSNPGSPPERELCGEDAVLAHHCIFPVASTVPPDSDGPFCFCQAPNPLICNIYGREGHGCANSVNPDGALLTATGTAKVVGDSFVLHGSGLPPTTLCIYIQGSGTVLVLYGDGFRCVGGQLKRVKIVTAFGGTTDFGGTPGNLISVNGAIPAIGGRRYYQLYYRNSAPSFACPATFNTSNAYAQSWAP